MRLKRQTLVEQLANHLVNSVQSQHVPPQQPLPSTAKLGADYGVSRAVVREALKILQAKGIIEVANGKTAIVKPITIEPLVEFFNRVTQLEKDSFADFMEIRRALEISTAALAAQRRTSEEMRKIKEMCEAMRQQVHHMDGYSELDLKLHLLIAHASHNKMLARLVESVREAIKKTIANRAVRVYGFSRKVQEEGQKLHERIVWCLERRDPEGAERAMRLHFDRFSTWLHLASDGKALNRAGNLSVGCDANDKYGGGSFRNSAMKTKD